MLDVRPVSSFQASPSEWSDLRRPEFVAASEVCTAARNDPGRSPGQTNEDKSEAQKAFVDLEYRWLECDRCGEDRSNCSVQGDVELRVIDEYLELVEPSPALSRKRWTDITRGLR